MECNCFIMPWISVTETWKEDGYSAKRKMLWRIDIVFKKDWEKIETKSLQGVFDDLF